MALLSPEGNVFAIKQVLGILLSPVAAAGILGVAALLLLLLPRTRRLGVVLLALLVLVGLPLGTTPVANALIRPLEEGYTAVTDPQALADSIEIQWVVVLGAGHASDSRAAPPGRLNADALHRLAEGIRLWREIPGARLHVSGWAGSDSVSNADAYASAARSLGVPSEALAFTSAPRDTQEEARAVAERIPAGEPFFLVTSASHLDRAMFFFESEGLRPIPAPANFYSWDPPTLALRDYLPSPENYLKVNRAAHEYIGMLWARLIVRGADE